MTGCLHWFCAIPLHKSIIKLFTYVARTTLRYDTIRQPHVTFLGSQSHWSWWRRHNKIRYGTIRYDATRYDTIRYATIRRTPRSSIQYGDWLPNMPRYTLHYSTIRYDTMRYDMIRYWQLYPTQHNCRQPVTPRLIARLIARCIGPWNAWRSTV